MMEERWCFVSNVKNGFTKTNAYLQMMKLKKMLTGSANNVDNNVLWLYIANAVCHLPVIC